MAPSAKPLSKTAFLFYGLEYKEHSLARSPDLCSICARRYRTSDSSSSSRAEFPVKIVVCGHTFGRDCLYTWVGETVNGRKAETHNTCPLCRAVLFTPTTDFSLHNSLANDASDASFSNPSYPLVDDLYDRDYTYRHYAEPDVISRSDARFPQVLILCGVSAGPSGILIRRRFPKFIIDGLGNWILPSGRALSRDHHAIQKAQGHFPNPWPWPPGVRVRYTQASLFAAYKASVSQYLKDVASDEEHVCFTQALVSVRTSVEAIPGIKQGRTSEVYKLQSELLGFLVNGLTRYVPRLVSREVYRGLGNLLCASTVDVICRLEPLNRPAPIEIWMRS